MLSEKLLDERSFNRGNVETLLTSLATDPSDAAQVVLIERFSLWMAPKGSIGPSPSLLTTPLTPIYSS